MEEKKDLIPSRDYFLISIARHGKCTKVIKLHRIGAFFICCFVVLGIYGGLRETYNEVQKSTQEQQELLTYRAQYAQQEEKLQALLEENERIQKNLAEVSVLEDEVRRTLNKDGSTTSRGNSDRMSRASDNSGQGGEGSQGLTKFDVVSTQNKILEERVAYKYQNLSNMLNDLQASSSVPNLWPLDSWDITSRFGGRQDPFGNGAENHKGVDVAASYGTPIYAAAAGTVQTAGWNGGYGRYVKLEHGNGYGSAYGHMSAIAVTAGQTVEKGEIIGYVGSSGYSTGSHLHFEVLINGNQVDPLRIVNK